MPIRTYSAVVGVRARPGMYVGSTGFSGLLDYLARSINLFLDRGPGRVHLSKTAEGFEVASDAPLAVVEHAGCKIDPFEVLSVPDVNDGCVLNALSSTFEALVRVEGQTRRLRYRQGVRVADETTEGIGDGLNRLRFAPDPEIFSVVDASPMVFESYLRRLSYLHAGVRFGLSIGDRDREFLAPRGIADLFDAVAAPYQLLHEPIRVEGSVGSLGLEMVFAYQGDVKDEGHCFINRGRAVQGGTHEQGLRRGFKKLCKELRGKDRPLGVVAVTSILYPETAWEGCIKARVGNPELVSMVADLLVAKVREIMDLRPDLRRQVFEAEPFQFPEDWSRR